MKNINMLINHVLNGFKSILKEPKSCDICSCLKCEKTKQKTQKIWVYYLPVSNILDVLNV